jgi:flavin reductase ActVB
VCADPRSVREALAKYPTGVTVVTTVDAVGERWGFTASSFTSVSLQPPVVLVCLARTAHCHQAFAEAGVFAVHVLAADQQDVALRFAQHEREKFAPFEFDEGFRGLPVLRSALAVLECVARDRLGVGDHTVLLGEVHAATATGGVPALYFDRAFHHLHRGES